MSLILIDKTIINQDLIVFVSFLTNFIYVKFIMGPTSCLKIS